MFSPADCSRISQKAFKNLKWHYESVVERFSTATPPVYKSKVLLLDKNDNDKERVKSIHEMQKRESTIIWFSYLHLPLSASACQADCSALFAPKLWIDESA
jgi:hypothetical protein